MALLRCASAGPPPAPRSLAELPPAHHRPEIGWPNYRPAIVMGVFWRGMELIPYYGEGGESVALPGPSERRSRAANEPRKRRRVVCDEPPAGRTRPVWDEMRATSLG